MRIFKITKEIEVVCNSESTRYGFRHLATMLRDGVEIQNGKCTARLDAVIKVAGEHK